MNKINYDLSKIKGIAFDVDGVLSPSTIPLHVGGEPMRMVNIKDGYAMQLAVKRGIRLAIITGGNTESVRKRYEGLGVQDVIMGASVKITRFDEWMEKYGFTPEEVAYVGDDIPDYQVLCRAGLPIAPADAAPEILAVAKYVTPCAGGYGVARDILQQVLEAQGLWMSDDKAFGW